MKTQDDRFRQLHQYYLNGNLNGNIDPFCRGIEGLNKLELLQFIQYLRFIQTEMYAMSIVDKIVELHYGE